MGRGPAPEPQADFKAIALGSLHGLEQSLLVGRAAAIGADARDQPGRFLRFQCIGKLSFDLLALEMFFLRQYRLLLADPGHVAVKAPLEGAREECADALFRRLEPRGPAQHGATLEPVGRPRGEKVVHDR